jgi:hypothetical protein
MGVREKVESRLTVGSSPPSLGELRFPFASINHGAHIEEQEYLNHSDETVNGESREVIRRKIAADDVLIEQRVTLAVEPLNLYELPAYQGDRRDEDRKRAEDGADGRILPPAPNGVCHEHSDKGGNCKGGSDPAPIHREVRGHP